MRDYAVELIRKVVPNGHILRREQSVGIVHSGTKARALACLCGEHITYCACGRVPKVVKEWRAAHRTCAAQLVGRVGARVETREMKLWRNGRIIIRYPVVAYNEPDCDTMPEAAVELTDCEGADAAK